MRLDHLLPTLCLWIGSLLCGLFLLRGPAGQGLAAPAPILVGHWTRHIAGDSLRLYAQLSGPGALRLWVEGTDSTQILRSPVLHASAAGGYRIQVSLPGSLSPTLRYRWEVLAPQALASVICPHWHHPDEPIGSCRDLQDLRPSSHETRDDSLATWPVPAGPLGSDRARRSPATHPGA